MSAENGHDFSDRCEDCHLGETGDGEQVFVDEIDTLCRECHDVARTNSHPSGMVVERELPPEFPLDIEGQMTCATCHDPCLEPSSDNPHLLRSYADEDDFCSCCHEGATICAGDNGIIFELTHAKAFTPASNESGSVDHVSADCIPCHDDGSGGPLAEYSLHSSVSSLDSNEVHTYHPVGQDYAAISVYNTRLRSIDDLSPLVSLVEGKVGCASCHNPYSEEVQFLVFNNRKSSLCQECHLL
ncbi:MAG: hypothetical protein GWN87_12715 [Desulfuromonadales bacterium]|nr:hypothetical protein [Desulfuromonadales bacterium]